MNLNAVGTHSKGVSGDPTGGTVQRYGCGAPGTGHQLRVAWRHGTSGVNQSITVEAKHLVDGDIETSVSYTAVGTISKTLPSNQQVFVNVLTMPFDVPEGDIVLLQFTPSNSNFVLLAAELIHTVTAPVSCA